MADGKTLRAWFVDADGFLVGDLEASGEGVDDFATLTKNAAANGQTAIDKDAPGAVKPPERPVEPGALQVEYASAKTTDERLDVIAKRQGLK